jgi:hypothetical protein
MLIFHSAYNFDFLRTAVSINQHWMAACVNLNFILSIWSMQYIWFAVLWMNTDLLDVMLSQLHTFTNVSKELTAPSSTGRRVTVLPEVAGNKHLQTSPTFLTDCTANTVSFIAVPNSDYGDPNMIYCRYWLVSVWLLSPSLKFKYGWGCEV